MEQTDTTSERNKAREREIIIIAVGMVVSVIVIAAFLLFIKSDADTSRPARSGDTLEATTTE